jgi:hypothetical protein
MIARTLFPILLLFSIPSWLGAQQAPVPGFEVPRAENAPAENISDYLKSLPDLSAFKFGNAPGPRFWVGADYLLWWVKSTPQPVPLVMTGPFDPSNPSKSTLGNPGTSVLYGGSNSGFDPLSGARLQLGYWLDQDRVFGLQASGFWFAQAQKTFSVQSNGSGSPFLGVPFFDTQLNQQGVAVVSHVVGGGNAGLVGGISVPTTLQLWGAEGNATVMVFQRSSLRADLLVGFRYLDLTETLNVQQNFSPLGLPLPAGFMGQTVLPGQTVVVSDGFNTRNQFYGAQIGGKLNYQTGKWNIDVLGKIALGDTVQSLAIGGNTTLNIPGQSPVSTSAGMLAGPSNSGFQQHNAFSVVPEIGINVGYDVTGWMRLKAGYSFMYWSNVVRPGDQVDHNVDPRQVPSLQSFTSGFVGAHPAPLFNRSDFWAQGITFGVEFRY